MAYLGSPSATKEIINKYSFAFQKKFGQNFLIDPRIVEKIVCSSSVDKECAVIEVGPGIGALTQVLARYAGYVRSYEIDTRFKGVYEEFLNEDHIDVVFDDFLKIDLTYISSFSVLFLKICKIKKQHMHLLFAVYKFILMFCTRINKLPIFIGK